jgi:serine/threonine protein kinase
MAVEFRSGGDLEPPPVGDLPRGSCRSVQDFEKSCRIGEGTYGTVYRAVEKKTGKVVALKRVLLHNEKQNGFPLTSLREIRLLKRLDHANCVALQSIAVGKARDSVFLCFEYCEHDMASLCEHGKRFSEAEVKGLMVQLLRAVEYLHDNWVIHRDLKMSNLLYNSRGQLKLADFGLARLYSTPARPMTPKVPRTATNFGAAHK